MEEKTPEKSEMYQSSENQNEEVSLIIKLSKIAPKNIISLRYRFRIFK
jgi:hypothetical protein